MDREQALNTFWNSFDVPAYDVNTVPEDAPFPRITYEVAINEFGVPVSAYGSIWVRETGWGTITAIAHEIDRKLSDGGHTERFDEGVVWIKKGTPFQQRMNDTDDSIRRIIVNVEIEYLEGRK